MSESRDQIVEILRGRVLRGLQAGTLSAGDRLPSTRDLAREFDVDYRLVLAAYQELAAEGLLELRTRGGIYVAAQPAGVGGMPPLPEQWMADVLSQGLSREIPAPELHEWLRRSTETLRLRAVVIASTEDQVYGLCRELRDDFGFESEGLLTTEARTTPPPLPVRRADVLITTAAHASWVRDLAHELRKRAIVVEVRPDLVGGEWAMLLRRPVYAIVATQEFGDMLRGFFANVPGIENLKVLVFGRDDVTAIPAGAPTYVTQRVRAQLGGVAIPGRILPAARTISTSSAKELFSFMVRANIEAMSRRER